MKKLSQFVNESTGESTVFGVLMQSVVEAWKAHLMTDKYAAHMALDEYYKEAPEAIDHLIEIYIGRHGKSFLSYDSDGIITIRAFGGDVIRYFNELRMYVRNNLTISPEDSEIQSALDDIYSLIDTVIYKLRDLS
jgi:hypothetical protein